MGKKEIDFRKRLLSTFKIEAHDHLKNISSGLVELERMPSHDAQMEIVEMVFRSSHSLKGASRAVNMVDIESLCQSLEDVFAIWKQKRINRLPGLFDTIYQTIDTIRTLVSSLEGGQVVPEKGQISKLTQELSRLAAKASEDRIQPEDSHPSEEGKSSPSSEDRPQQTITKLPPQSSPCEGEGYQKIFQSINKERLLKEYPTISETVRISTAKLSLLLFQAEEMLTAKQAVGQYFSNFRDVARMLEPLKRASAKVYLELQKARRENGRKNGGYKMGLGASQTAALQEFFLWTQTHIGSIEDKLEVLIKSTRRYNATFDRMVDDLLDDVKKVMMLPFSTLLESFPMLVRDIASEQGKDVELIIHGEGIEIDKRVLEEMKDPLIHLVRNCIDHGIENPDVRAINNKPLRGAVTVAISPVNGSKVEIRVSDDGAGIALAKVKEASVRNGIISQMEADTLTEEETVPLIFYSGVSTSPIITDISGRGLGLAIVKERVEKLGGTLSIKTGFNTGTTFHILLPLTVATFRGILVRQTDQVFIIPTMSVERTLRIRNDEIKTIENKETVLVNDRPVSFVRLGSVLELSPPKKREVVSEFTTVLVLNVSGKRIAFGVDTILGEQEVLVKGLGKQLLRVRNIAGATILGSGKPVPILNVSDLTRSAVKSSASPAMPAVVAEETEVERKSILIVEDSITSRILLKSILETAGYGVKTAVDGIDAITLLKTESFDLVVADIEMPRMDGFDLTSKIRDDKRLASLPVVLVTALESREDRERGIDVGANAYIVKSSFDQSNLLEVVKRLI